MKMRWQTIASSVSMRTISPTATPLPTAYDCVAVYIAGRRTNLDNQKCPRYFRRDSRGNPRDLNMCRTGRSAALSRGRKSMPPRRESMKLDVQQRKFT